MNTNDELNVKTTEDDELIAELEARAQAEQAKDAARPRGEGQGRAAVRGGA